MNRFFWAAGTGGVALSVLESAWVAHTKSLKLTDADKVSINNAVHI